MTAGPVHAARKPARLSGLGNTASNLFREPSLTGNNTASPVPGPLRAAISHLGRPFFLQGRNNLIYHFIKSFRFWRIGPGSFLSPQARAFSLISQRASRPIAVTRILCDGGSRSFKFTNALCCTTGQIITQEYDVVLHASKIGRETYQRAVQGLPKVGKQEGHQRNV